MPVNPPLPFFFLLGIALAIPPAYGNSSGCIEQALEDLIHDKGVLNQKDERLVAAGFASANQNNMLCGPTCFWNVMSAIEKKVGGPVGRLSDPVADFRQLQSDLGNATRVQNGLGWADLVKSLETRFKRSGRKFAVDVIHAEDPAGLKIEDLGSADHAVILELEFSRPVLKESTYDTGYRTTGGHYVLIKSVDRDRKLITVVDPDGGVERTLKYSIEPNEFDQPRIRLQYDPQISGFEKARIEANRAIRIGLPKNTATQTFAPPPAPKVQLSLRTIEQGTTEGWIEPTGKGKFSPPPQAVEKSLIANEPMGIVWPSWSSPTSDAIADAVKNEKTWPRGKYPESAPMDAILVPKSKRQEVAAMMEKMGAAPTYDQGIGILRDYMENVGLIERVPHLKVYHASDVPPDVILKDGLLSSKELEARNRGNSRWGQNIGDGIYTVGASDWGPSNGWGKYVYELNMEDPRILRGSNPYLAAFVKIYDLYRGKWGLKRYADDSIMVPGLPQGVLSYNGLLARLPFIYRDLFVEGVSSNLEILIKRRMIPPHHIKVLEQGKSAPPLPSTEGVSQAIDELREEKGQLLRQNSRPLKDAGLAVGNGGGLCGPTCVWNLGTAIERGYGISPKRLKDPVSEMSRLQRAHATQFKNGLAPHDIRYGMGAPRLFGYIREEFEGQPGVRRMGLLYATNGDDLNLYRLHHPHRAMLISVRGWDTQNTKPFNGHWYFVKDVDPKHGTVSVVNPQDPNAKEDLVVEALRNYPGKTGQTMAVSPSTDIGSSGKASNFYIESVIYLDLDESLHP